MKLNWGSAIAIVLVLFAAMLLMFMYRASNNLEELVHEDYYERELRYQERIDQIEQARALDGPVKFQISGDSLVLFFPSEMHGRTVTGKLELMRPSDKRFDTDFDIHVNEKGRCAFFVKELARGAYRAGLEWQVAGASYYSEEPIYLP